VSREGLQRTYFEGPIFRAEMQEAASVLQWLPSRLCRWQAAPSGDVPGYTVSPEITVILVVTAARISNPRQLLLPHEPQSTTENMTSDVKTEAISFSEIALN
jgi:hypothetical protein